MKCQRCGKLKKESLSQAVGRLQRELGLSRKEAEQPYNFLNHNMSNPEKVIQRMVG